MIDWLGIMALATTTAQALPASTQVVHRGNSYDVTYHAQTQARHKSVGMSAPTRQGSERCERTVTVVAERRIALPGADAALTHRLPGARTWRDSTPGHCRKDANAQAAVAQRSAQIAQFLAEAMERDRPDALAAIEAAHALAAR
ncbi:hypothetical protein ABIC78_002215 [Novosphingobium sp. 1529]|uniref:hypothetical protein n=1 Tax=Novosphingobium sp. 1529 TaxID=3156424 RepID=UPI00145BAEC7